MPSRADLDAKWLPGHRWVAEIDGEVVGWTASTPVSTRDCYRGVAETSVYVTEGYRGRGVGKAFDRSGERLPPVPRRPAFEMSG